MSRIEIEIMSTTSASAAFANARVLEPHPKGERRNAAHASTSLSTNGFSSFQLPFIGSNDWFIYIYEKGM